MRLHLALLPLLTGCAALTTARPLEPGQHELGATFGGPMVRAFGAVIPLPMLVVQGRSGVARLGDRPLDLSYGFNATGLPFGALSAHGGASVLLAHPSGAVPAISVADRLYLAANPVDDAAAGARGLLAVNLTELTASWDLGRHLLFVSVSQATDLRDPGLLLTPSLGAVLDPGPERGFQLQLAVRWWGASHRPITDRVDWVPGGLGALGADLGLSWTFGEAR